MPHEQALRRKMPEECRRPGGLELTRRACALCDFPAGARIVDVGCGAGASVRMLRELGYACVGFDVDMRTKNFPGARARAEALPVARESLHGILCECVLSLLQNPEGILQNFWDSCRLDGCLLLTDLYRKLGGPTASVPFLSRWELENVLHGTGWRVTHFEDCSRALKAYVTRLLWHAADDDEPWPQSDCAGIHWRACSYGMWIAHKEAQ